jgi:hypothetical protein
MTLIFTRMKRCCFTTKSHYDKIYILRIKRVIFGIVLGLSILAFVNSFKEENHLFILSGQSNMVNLNPNLSFTPLVNKEFGEENVTVIKEAHEGKAIRNWFKYWEFNQNSNKKSSGVLYDSLIKKVLNVYNKKEYSSVTLVWMQGESDAKEEASNMYEANIRGLVYQLSKDLNRLDINCVIGRLSDYGFYDEDYVDWHKIRKIQLALGLADPRNTWVNTDDLNDGLDAQGNIVKNDFHYTVEGYQTLGERFAVKSIGVIKKNNSLLKLISF